MRQAESTDSLKGMRNRRIVSIVFQFAILFVFWIILSGRFQAKYIIFGVLSVGLATFLSNDLFFDSLQRGESLNATVSSIFRQLWNFLLYIPWLIWQIILANIGVAMIVLNPKMPIDPGFLVFKTVMKKNISRVTLANSITLTPGTITCDLESNVYVIHNLQPPLAGSLVDGSMQNKVAKIYLEEEETKPESRWAYSLEEL